MKLLYTQLEFKKFYPYESIPANKYPKKYPVFATIVDHCGGIMGDYLEVKLIYPPKNCDLKSFELGLKTYKKLIE